MAEERQENRGLAGQMASAVGWLARRRSVPLDVAEEAVQEALLQLVERAAPFLPDDLGGWVRHVADRRLTDIERHRLTQLPGQGLSIERESSDGPNLDDILTLRAAFRSLEPELRTLVVFRLAGASWRETAKATGLSEEAARKRFALGLEAVRDLMGDSDPA